MRGPSGLGLAGGWRSWSPKRKQPRALDGQSIGELRNGAVSSRAVSHSNVRSWARTPAAGPCQGFFPGPLSACRAGLCLLF